MDVKGKNKKDSKGKSYVIGVVERQQCMVTMHRYCATDIRSSVSVCIFRYVWSYPKTI